MNLAGPVDFWKKNLIEWIYSTKLALAFYIYFPLIRLENTMPGRVQ